MKSVLIVDDSIVSRKMLAKLIESSGYTVASHAINGKEALELYKKLSPDVVTMDITMPEMNGIDALKMIREYDSDAKVVIISAAGQAEKKQENQEVNKAQREAITALQQFHGYITQHELRNAYNCMSNRPWRPEQPALLPSPMIIRIYLMLLQNVKKIKIIRKQE